MTDDQPHFRRILLKLSGEALMGEASFGIDPKVLNTVAGEIYEVHELGVAVAVVIGGGNIFRGLNASAYRLTRVPADQMGMLATVINALALGEALNQRGAETRVMSAIDMNKIAEPYIRGRALAHLNKGRVVILAAGTGNPYFSTDTAAALRAMEVDAEVLLKATKVEGVYASDPQKNPTSKPFSKLTYQEVLEHHLQVMDMTAVALAMGHHVPIIVFNLRKKGNIRKVVLGKKVGTFISEGEGDDR